MVELLVFKQRVARHACAQLAKELFVGVGKDDGGVDLATPDAIQFLHGTGSVCVGNGANGEGNEQFVGVHTGIAATEVCFEMHDGLNDLGGDELDQHAIIFEAAVSYSPSRDTMSNPKSSTDLRISNFFTRP